MSLFSLDGHGGVSDEEIALGTPDMSEAKSLKHHVERCAMRYRMFTKRQATQGSDLVQIKYMMLGLIGAIAATSQQMREVVAWALKVL